VHNNKAILVTGAAGFLGSHLCEFLLAQGNYVYGIDNLVTGREENLSHCKTYDKFKFINFDITQKTQSIITLDRIYNLACPASPEQYQKDPVRTITTCVAGAINMLDLATQTNARILQASTSEIYGDPLEHPQTESYWGNVNPIGIRSCYDEGKRCAETLFFDYYRQYNTDIRVARIFNTYGPHMSKNDGRVVSNFVTQALANKNITVYGNGLRTRSFCYVDDTIKGLVALMESSFIGPINIGNPVEYTILDIAKKVIELTNTVSTIEFMPAIEDDPQKRKPDISLAKSMLNWAPIIELEHGLTNTIEYFKEAQ